MLFCLHIFFTYSICINTHVQVKAGVNTFYIKEDKIFSIEFKLILTTIVVCLFVYMNIVDLFIYVFPTILSWSLKLKQSMPTSRQCYTYLKVSNILYYII